MIKPPLLFHRPFDHEDLAWCKAEFLPSDTTELQHNDPTWGNVRVKLPSQLTRAVEKRRTEFLAGRLCAAYALRQLGKAEEVGCHGRKPVWPVGVSGSITHTDQRAFSVASESALSLGVDCEPIMSASKAREIWSLVLSEKEYALRPAHMSFAAFVTTIFASKEAFYKAMSSFVDRMLEFHEVNLISIEDSNIDLLFEGSKYRLLWRKMDGDCLALCRLDI